MGELGTGCGVGTSWLASGMRPGVRLVTFEREPARADAVRTLFADEPRVTVVAGDSMDAERHGPFDLLFADGGLAKDRDAELILGIVKVGGIVVLDDLTAVADWDDERRRTGDPVRAFWLTDPRVAAAEVGVGLDKFGNGTRAAAIVATRVA